MDHKNLATLFLNAQHRHRDHTCFWVENPENQTWNPVPWPDVRRRVEGLSRGLIALGHRPDDRIAIFAENHLNWFLFDLAIQCAGCVTVPIYSTLTPELAGYILQHSQARSVMVTDLNRPKVQSLLHGPDRPLDLRNIMISGSKGDLGDLETHLEDVERLGRMNTTPEDMLERVRQIQPNQVSTIMYTSGTTGAPKGVMLSHQNIASNVAATEGILDLSPNDVHLSLLPLAHAFERTVGFYAMMHHGCQIAIGEDLNRIQDYLQSVRPTMMVVVPRLLEKAYASFTHELGKLPGPLRRLVEKGAIRREKSWIFDRWLKPFIQKKIKGKFGGRIRYMICGGAALKPSINRFFNDMGLTVLQGYGLTETSPIVCTNRPDDNTTETLGPCVKGVQIKIADDGEILVLGPNVMLGYYRDPKSTDASFTPDGWFKTGDIGKVDAQGRLIITDRKRHIFKMSNGKMVAPTPLENDLEDHVWIHQACLIGEGRNFVSALIVPNMESIALTHPDVKKMHADERKAALSSLLEKEVVDTFNASQPSYQGIKRFLVLDEPFTIANDLLTPTLKLKRKKILDVYGGDIDAMYT